jgi:hypothetical protein
MNETSDITFSSEDVNVMFNAFLDTYLKIFYSSFPIQRIQTATKRNDWITSGITTLCKHKRELYIACKNNPELRNYYKKYCKTLSTVINLYRTNAPSPFKSASYERTKSFKCPVHSCRGLEL